MPQLFLASIWSLGLLSGFVLILILMVVMMTGISISLPMAIGITILWNVLLWLVSPWISDFMYRFLYKAEWVGIDGIRAKSPASAQLIQSICDQYGITTPKLGIIPDNNPNAFKSA